MPTFNLDLCPSVNALYSNVRGRGRVKTARYRSWVRGQLNALLAQRARPVEPPVSISIILPESMRGDADGRIKATIDLFVRAGVIPNDSKKIVRSIAVSFANRIGMAVTIESIPS